MGVAVTFVLAGSGRAGGTRTTVEMAARLTKLGHRARVACQVPPPLSRGDLRARARKALNRIRGIRHDDWLEGRDEVVYCHALEELGFESGEIVVAVGSWTIEDVHRLDADVLKLRWCKGFQDHLPAEMQRRWGIPMATVVVSEPLIPKVEDLSGHGVLAVTPNGIDTDQYFIEDRVRDGVGGILGHGWKKAPETFVRTMVRIHAEMPDLPRYLFGTPPRPRALPRECYWRYPSIERARELYNRSRLWLVTSRSEGFCNPILEAMACGAVVVSTRHDSAPGLIEDGRNGFFVPIDDIEAFVGRVHALRDDEATLERVRRAGLETVSRFSWERAADRMAAVLERLVAEGDRPGPRR